jgi:hypothetical protein
MTPQQIAAVYDSMIPEQQNMPREQFIRQCMDTLDPVANKKILDHMVQRKRQVTQGRLEQARIDAVLRERG